MSRPLSHSQARAFYDRFGAGQDLQRFYEDPAVRALEAHADFEGARAVVELGCGTGRFARGLFERRLAPQARYLGLDVSATMVALARVKLEPWAERAEVRQTDGEIAIPVPDASCDRVVSAYVLELLSADDVRAALAEAHRVLTPEGRLCLASLAPGRSAGQRAVSGLWRLVYDLRPQLVGGCRPVRLRDSLGEDWRILYREELCSFGLCSEVVVAQPAPSR